MTNSSSSIPPRVPPFRPSIASPSADLPPPEAVRAMRAINSPPSRGLPRSFFYIVFLFLGLEDAPVGAQPVRAIQDIKAAYNLTRNWQGDPCVPKNYTWDGLHCDYYDGFEAPRIISLNLSSSGLLGGIPGSFANLTALTSLDLSNNSLSGSFPNFLAELPALKSLNLVGNKISLPSEDLCAKVTNGRLSLRIDGLDEVCSIQPSSNSPSPSSNSQRPSSSFSNKQKYLAPISITTSLVLLVVILM